MSYCSRPWRPRLPGTCSEVYKEFVSDNFVLQKTFNIFSAIALDQGHEQSNAIIKGVSRVVGSLTSNMDTALRQWEVTVPKVSRMLG